VGASLFLVVWFICIPGRPDTRVFRSLRPPGPVAPRLFTEKQSNSTRPTVAFLDDSGCRQASAEHMMGLPQ